MELSINNAMLLVHTSMTFSSHCSQYSEVQEGSTTVTCTKTSLDQPITSNPPLYRTIDDPYAPQDVPMFVQAIACRWIKAGVVPIHPDIFLAQLLQARHYDSRLLPMRTRQWVLYYKFAECQQRYLYLQIFYYFLANLQLNKSRTTIPTSPELSEILT